MKRVKKRICVVGLGQFGSELAAKLAEDKACEVLALDNSEDRVNAIADKVQRALIFDARDYGSLSSVVGEGFDEAIVSLGESVEASILCTLHLRKLGIKYIRAKAISEDHALILEKVGASETIFPERETADRLAKKIINPNLMDMVPLSEGFQVVEVVPPDSFHGKSLLELNLRERFGAFVIAVQESVPERVVFLPGPGFVVKPSDALVLIGREGDLERLQESS